MSMLAAMTLFGTLWMGLLGRLDGRGAEAFWAAFVSAVVWLACMGTIMQGGKK
jgi:hypothetical protein